MLLLQVARSGGCCSNSSVVLFLLIRCPLAITHSSMGAGCVRDQSQNDPDANIRYVRFCSPWLVAHRCYSEYPVFTVSMPKVDFVYYGDGTSATLSLSLGEDGDATLAIPDSPATPIPVCSPTLAEDPIMIASPSPTLQDEPRRRSRSPRRRSQ